MKKWAAVRTAFARWCMVTALIVTQGVQALELADARREADGALVASLVGADSFTPTSVFVRLASASAHSERGVARPEADLRFAVQSGANGLVLRIVGPNGVPADAFLIEVFSPNGREVLRFDTSTTPMVATALPSESVTVTSPAVAAPSPAVVEPSAMPARQIEPATQPAGRTVTVQRGETLWAIAGRYQSGGISTARMARAIQDGNPQAFSLRDPDQILEGSVITIPDLAENVLARTPTPPPVLPTREGDEATRRIEEVIAARDARLERPAEDDNRRDVVRQLEQARFGQRQAETRVMELESRLAGVESERDALRREVMSLTSRLEAADTQQAAAPARPARSADDAGQTMTLRENSPPAGQPQQRPDTPRQSATAPAGSPPSGGMGWIIGISVFAVVAIGAVATVMGIRRNRKAKAEGSEAESDAPDESPAAPEPTPADDSAMNEEPATNTAAYEPPREPDEPPAEAEVAASAALEDEEDDLEDIGLIIPDAGTKLALARAYVDIDDAESAREILVEVIREGSDKERSDAEALLAKIDA